MQTHTKDTLQSLHVTPGNSRSTPWGTLSPDWESLSKFPTELMRRCNTQRNYQECVHTYMMMVFFGILVSCSVTNRGSIINEI